MLGGLFNQLIILITCTLAAFIFGHIKGQNYQKIKRLKANVQDAIQTKQRRAKRKRDDMAIVRRRMRRYTAG